MALPRAAVVELRVVRVVLTGAPARGPVGGGILANEVRREPRFRRWICWRLMLGGARLVVGSSGDVCAENEDPETEVKAR